MIPLLGTDAAPNKLKLCSQRPARRLGALLFGAVSSAPQRAAPFLVRLQVRSLVRVHTGGNQLMYLFHINVCLPVCSHRCLSVCLSHFSCFSPQLLSFPLLSLKSIFFKKKCMLVKPSKSCFFFSLLYNTYKYTLWVGHSTFNRYLSCV